MGSPPRLAQRAGLQAGPGAQAGARGQGPGLGVRASRVRIPQRTGESSRAGDPRRGSRRRLGSSRRLACHQTSSLTPIFNIPTAGLRPLRLLVWPQGLQMPSSLRYRTRHLGLGHPLGSRGGADAGLGLRARAPTAVILQGGDPQALLLSWSPGTLSGTEGASPRGPPARCAFGSVGSLSKFRDVLSPTLALAQPEQVPPGVQASLFCVQPAGHPQQGLHGPHLSPARSRSQPQLPLVGCPDHH